MRLLKTNIRLKKTRQLNEQLMTNLIVYLNSLKIQLSKELINYQKYFNLIKAFHFYLKNDSSNHRDRFQKRIERDFAFNREDRVRFETHQKDQKEDQ